MAKKLFLTPVFFMIVFFAISQTNKGQWIVGGNTSFLYSNANANINEVSNSNKTTSLQFTGGSGYFFMNKLCGGLRTGVSHSVIKQVINAEKVSPFFSYYSATSKITALIFSPFIRYYFLPNGKKINIIGDVSYSYNYNKSENETFQRYTDLNSQFPIITASTTNIKDHASSYSIAAGPALFLNSKVSLELLLGYSHSKYSKSKLSSNNLSIEAGFQVHLGKS